MFQKPSSLEAHWIPMAYTSILLLSEKGRSGVNFRQPNARMFLCHVWKSQTN